ncbi:MAG: hypothetical protein HY074_02605 [Deltaproteobacteria bacterium]|nr:hypothetical protein [Deltaproteobacteria bacterium]
MAPATECAALLSEAIPAKWVEKMLKEGKASDPQTQRLREVVQRMGFSNAALNAAIVKAHNERYTVQTAQGMSTNQKQSGRCWIFAGLNMMRSTLIAEGKVPANFEFSENYLHFFNMLEKSNRYLEGVIKKTYSAGGKKTKLSGSDLRSAFEPSIGDGGWYEYFMFLVSKYGVVPKDAMPETKSSESTATMLAELKRHLAESARGLLLEAQAVAKEGAPLTEAQYLDRVRVAKERALGGIWNILATHLGDPPGEFEYRSDGKNERKGNTFVTPTNVSSYTPQQFAWDFVKFDPRDYVVVATSAAHEHGVFEQKKTAIGPAEISQDEFDIRFMNVGIDRLEALAIASIEGGHPLWFAADVGKDVDHATGIMHPDIYQRDPLYNTESLKLNRALASFFGVTSPNHAMLLTGFDRPDPNGPVVKFKNENSWGDGVGTKGTYHLYREWFEQNVFQIIVHKKFLTASELKAWAGEAEQLGENAQLF